MSNRTLRLRRILPVVLAAGLVTSACEGPNRFAGPGRVDARGGSGGPDVEIEAPRADSLTARPLGDSILVRAKVSDDVGVDSVRMIGLALRGDPLLGTNVSVTRFGQKTIVLPSVRDTVLTRYLLATNDTTRERVSIVVEAFDSDGLRSSDTTRVIVGGPSVDLLNLEDNQAVQSGLGLSLQLRASDPNGIVNVQFRISGAFTATLSRSFNPALDSVRLDTAVVIPPGTLGDIQILAVARNTLDISGQDGPVRLRVVAPGAQDNLRPSLSMTVTSAERLEARDSVRVRLNGADDTQGSGVVRAGLTVTATSPRRGTSQTRSFVRDLTPPRTGNLSETLSFAPFNIDPTVVPDTMTFEITAYMLDASGNCAAAVTPGATQSLPCSTEGFVTAQSANPFRLTRMVVAGHTVVLPAGGKIMDAAVDVTRRNLMLANMTRDRIEVFRLESERFGNFIPVGSEPWGLNINRTGDTLLVANSGGTNVSSVYLGPISGAGPMFEVPQARFLTPDVRLFDVERKIENGILRWNVYLVPPGAPASFSDRPQFLTQDFSGRVLYSTKTTLIGNVGTIRKAFVPSRAVAPEVVLFWEHGAMLPSEDFTGVANADRVVSDPSGLGVIVYDHKPGFPDSLITVGPLPPADAASAARALGSDAVASAGRFSVNNIGFTDTTFVAGSGDRRWAVFGEGRAAVGRIIMYDAGRDRISDVVRVTDLITNASERVRGIGLNYDGTLGVARGNNAYFFTTDLRLQGVAALPMGGAGAVLHPLHANARSLDNPTGIYDPNTHLAFVGTGERTIDIFDTFHFFRSGRIFIRDVVSGPLRAVLPFPSDNAGHRCAGADVKDLTGTSIGQTVEIFENGDFSRPYPPNGATEDTCIVLKLFGVTDSGGVVVIDVRKSDILRNHPSRN
jgi:hypothetical protein